MRPLSLGAAVFVASLLPSLAHAKAATPWHYVENLEVVITNVDVSWADGDSDLNIVFRPLWPGKEVSAFPNVPNKADFISSYWRPWANDWVSGTCGWKGAIREFRALYSAVSPPSSSDDWCAFGWDETVTKPPAYSAACKACAGYGPDGVGCQMAQGTAYETNPCSKLFSCSPCIQDLNANSGYGRSFFWPKAELFVAQNGCTTEGPTECNDPNPSFEAMLRGLGILCPTCSLDMSFGASGDQKEFCSEEFDSAANPIAKPNEICGKHVLISGVVNFDELHWERPEIHPVSKMTVKWGEGDYRLLALVDGSKDGDTASWDTDYHDMFKDDPASFPSSMTFDLSQLEGPKPQGSYLPQCTVETGASVNLLKNPKFTPQVDAAGERCAKIDIALDGGVSTGAVWTAAVKTSFRNPKVKLGMTSHLDALWGVVSNTMPKQAPTGACKLPSKDPGDFTLPLLDWWYYSLDFSIELDGISPKALDWKWTSSGNNLYFPQDMTKIHPTHNSHVGVWLAFRGYHDEPFVAETLTGKAYFNGALVGQVQTTISRPPANVVLSASSLAFNPTTGTYNFGVAALPNFFCGPSKSLAYEWTRTVNGKSATPPSGLQGLYSGLGMHDVQTFEVTVNDTLKVESAHDAIVIAPPALTANITTKCAAGALESIPTNPPQGAQWKPGSKPPTSDRCKEIVLIAKADETKGKGLKFPPGAVSGVTYKWTVNAPPGASVTTLADRVILKPTGASNFEYDVSVVATDKWKRTASASAHGSSDYSSPQQLAAQLQGLWQIFHFADPLPQPSACLRGCPGAKVNPDPMARLFALNRNRAMKARPSTIASLRNEMKRFANYYVSKSTGRPLVVPKRFGTKPKLGVQRLPSELPSRQKLMEKARSRFRNVKQR